VRPPYNVDPPEEPDHYLREEIRERVYEACDDLLDQIAEFRARFDDPGWDRKNWILEDSKFAFDDLNEALKEWKLLTGEEPDERNYD